MSKNSSDSYGEAQKGVLRMARVNCNYNRENTSLRKKRDSMGNDIYENGKPCRYGKIPGLEKPVSRMIFGTAIGPMIEGKNADELLDAAFAKGIHTFDTARGYGRAEESLGGPSWTMTYSGMTTRLKTISPLSVIGLISSSGIFGGKFP